VHPRTRRRLYSVLALVAVFAATTGVFIAAAGFLRGAPGAGLGGTAIVVAAIAAIAFAYRRARSLLHDERLADVNAADAAATEALAGLGVASVFVARVRWRTYLVLLLATGVGGAAIALGLHVRSYLFAALGLLVAVPVGRVLYRALCSRAALVVDWRGIDDRLHYGFIPWADVREATVYEDFARRLMPQAELELRLRNVAQYRARRDWLARLTVKTSRWRDRVLIQLGTLDQPPRAVLRAMISFHERTLPEGAISFSDTRYEVDEHGPRRRELERERDALLAVLGDEAGRARDPAVKSDPAAASALVERMLARSRELDVAMAEIDRIDDRRVDAFERRFAQARTQWWVPVLMLAAILAWIGYMVVSRLVGP